MAERKPPDKSWDTWIEELIRQAQADGQFEDLEGAGRPIPGLDAPYDPLWWVKRLMEREKLSMLPEALAIRAKVERELQAIASVPREEDVRARIAALNAEIRRANRATAEGPPTTLSPLDADAVVEAWRSRRSAS
jgi:hypothetical protein